jgi:hypothetical protein
LQVDEPIEQEKHQRVADSYEKSHKQEDDPSADNFDKQKGTSSHAFFNSENGDNEDKENLDLNKDYPPDDAPLHFNNEVSKKMADLNISIEEDHAKKTKKAKKGTKKQNKSKKTKQRKPPHTMKRTIHSNAKPLKELEDSVRKSDVLESVATLKSGVLTRAQRAKLKKEAENQN